MSVCVGLGKQFGKGERVCLEHESIAVHIQNTLQNDQYLAPFLELSAVFKSRAVNADVVCK